MSVQPRQYDSDHNFQEYHWRELIDKVRPGGPGGFGKRRAEDEITGIIDFARIPAAIRHCLGYSYTLDATGGGGIIRIPPVQHPWMPLMFCDGVTYRPSRPSGNPVNPQNQPHLFTDPEFIYSFTRYSKYQTAEFTLHFSIPRYYIASDAEMGELSEWDRYTYMFDTKPNLQLQSVEGSTMMFVEGPPIGKIIQSAIGIRMAITAHIMTWYEVPFDYLSSSGYVPDMIVGRSANAIGGRLDSAVGHVNSADMFDGLFEAGTIYLDNPVIDWYIQPVETEDGTRLWAADIELPFMHHDPLMADPPSQPAWRGWNTFPWMGAQTSDTASNRIGRWYTATHDGNLTGSKLLPTSDLMRIFNHWNTP